MPRLAAGVRKRRDGAMEKRFTVSGRRYSVYGHSQHELNVKEQKLRIKIESGCYLQREVSYSYPENLNEYFSDWMKGKRLTVKSGTLRVYHIYYEPYLAPTLGSLRLEQIGRGEITELQRTLAAKLSPVTVNMAVTVLKIILNDAVRDGLLVKNPASDIKPVRLKEKASETYHRALTVEEQKVFLKAAERSCYYELFCFMLLTGLRQGEVCSLYWSDIDLEKMVVHVRRTITRTEDGRWCIGNTPKSEAGRRDIPINSQILGLLELQKTTVMQKNRAETISKLIFTSPRGKMITNSQVNHEIRDILKKINGEKTVIKRFTSHALRDTFATRYIEKGGSPQTLKMLLGHSSFAMTMDLYSHVLPETMQKEMKMIRIF